MSPLLDVPAQLALALSLAAASIEGAQPNLPPPIAQPSFTGHVDGALEGPLLFSEHSWMRALHGVPDEAQKLGGRVFVTSGGRFYVPAPGAHQRMLVARNNAKIAAKIAQAAARENARRMRPLIGKPAVAADLLIAHVVDVSTAVALVSAVENTPDLALATAAPRLAAVFSIGADGTHQAITVEQFYRLLIAKTAAPPRLVALGLKPRPRSENETAGQAARADRERVIAAWRARINAVPAAAATQ